MIQRMKMPKRDISLNKRRKKAYIITVANNSWKLDQEEAQVLDYQDNRID